MFKLQHAKWSSKTAKSALEESQVSHVVAKKTKQTNWSELKSNREVEVGAVTVTFSFQKYV